MATEANARSNRRLGWVLAGGVAGMLGLAFASAPLYDLFCRVTGYGGTPRTEVTRTDMPEHVPSDLRFSVLLDANVSKRLTWEFGARTAMMEVEPGVETLAIYRAKNIGEKDVVGTATFNVTPLKAGQYVAKMECFCFTEQRLAAGEEVDMPVSFYIDPAILDDPNTQDVQDIVLSYTFYPSVEPTAALDTNSPANGG